MSQAPVQTPGRPGPSAQAPTSAPSAVPSSPLGVGTGSLLTRARVLLGPVVEGTPGRMRLVAAAAALVAAVFGLVGATALWSSAASLERADHNASQVVRVQGIYADLLRADAAATNAFLVGGLENPAQRADYDTAMGSVARAVTAAATAQPADGTALGALNASVQTYAATVEQARVYNRQGLPLGAQYLNNASTGLRSTALPLVDAVAQANAGRAEQEFAASSNAVGLTVAGVVALLALVAAMVWLARRTHRYLNAPLAASTALLLLALGLGATTLGSVSTHIAAVRGTAYQSTVSLASARSAAFDAKAQESLTLIARAGSTSEASWKRPSDAVLENLKKLAAAQPAASTTAADLTRQWNDYVAQHQAIRQLDDGGQWEQAVAAATRTDNGSANALFTAFTTSAGRGLDTFSSETQARLDEPRTRTTIIGWALLVICLAAAGLAVRGVAQRLQEYR